VTYSHVRYHSCMWPIMGWLRFVGSYKLQVSFAEYSLFYRALLQKWRATLRSLLKEATSYHVAFTGVITQVVDCYVHPKTPLYSQKSPMYTQKSHMYTQRSHSRVVLPYHVHRGHSAGGWLIPKRALCTPKRAIHVLYYHVTFTGVITQVVDC